MIRAVIDIGTNSVRLLTAEKLPNGEWHTLQKGLNASRLGEGMTLHSGLSEAACCRTMEAVMQFAAMAEEKTGIPVEILSGEMEAFYSYFGAVGMSSSVSAVTDVGGGSTEVCMGFGPTIGYRHSFPIGCVRCSGLFDTTTARGIGELKKYCFQKFQESKDLAPVKHWICVGGTATSMAAMLQELETYDAAKVQDYVIQQEDVPRLLKELYQMSYEDRCYVKGLRADRADIIVAGVAIIDSLMEYFALPEITVSDRGLTEGLLDADVVKPER